MVYRQVGYSKHTSVALAATRRGMNATPNIPRVFLSVVNQILGSLFLTVPREAKPDERRVNAPSPCPSFDIHPPLRHLPFTHTGGYSWTCAAAVKCLAISPAPEGNGQPTPVLHPRLPITRPSDAQSRQQKLRTMRLLALIHSHSLSGEPNRSSLSFGYDHGSGSSQGPWGFDLRLEDGTGIFSGQGPGPELSLLDEFLNSINTPEPPSQEPDALSGTLTHSPITSSFPQQPTYAPPPPVPPDQYSAGYSAGHSTGYSRGYSVGYSEGHSAGYYYGVSQVHAALARFMQSTIRPPNNQKASIHGSLNR